MTSTGGPVIVLLGTDEENGRTDPLLASPSEHAEVARPKETPLPWWKQSRFVIPILAIGTPFAPGLIIPLALLCFVKLQQHVLGPVLGPKLSPVLRQFKKLEQAHFDHLRDTEEEQNVAPQRQEAIFSIQKREEESVLSIP